MAPSTKSDQLTTVALSVFRLNGLLVEWGNAFARPHGLTSARWQVMGALALTPEALTIPQIAAIMGITRQGVLKQIDLLLAEGLVRTMPNPQHKRSPLHALTAQGRAAYQALEQRWYAHVKGIAGDFSTTDLDGAVRVLSGLLRIHETAAQGTGKP